MARPADDAQSEKPATRARGRFVTVRSAVGLTAITGLSPLTGFAVEAALAWRFGASATMDAYRLAYILVWAASTIFVMQVVPNVVVPIYMEFKSRGQEEEGWRAAFSFANLMLVPAVILSVTAFIWPQPIVSLLGPGLTWPARGGAISLVRWFGLTFIPLAWTGAAIGVLYTQEVFWLVTVASSLGNVLLLIMVIAFGRRWSIYSLAIGTSGGAFLTAGLAAIMIARPASAIGAHKLLSFDPTHPGVLKALRLSIPLIAAACVTQASTVAVNRALSRLPVGTLAMFGYAWKMGVLITIVPAALATVLFPQFAESWHTSSRSAFADFGTKALRQTMFVAIPLSGVVYALRNQIVAFMLGHGAFSVRAVEGVASLLGLFVLGGGIAAACNACLQKIMYAAQAMWLATCAQMVSATMVALAAPTVGRHFGAIGVMGLCVCAIWLSVLVILLIAAKDIGLQLGSLIIFALKLSSLVAIAIAFTAALATAVPAEIFGGGLIASATALSSKAICMLLLFCGLARALRVPEAITSFEYVQWQADAFRRRFWATAV